MIKEGSLMSGLKAGAVYSAPVPEAPTTNRTASSGPAFSLARQALQQSTATVMSVLPQRSLDPISLIQSGLPGLQSLIAGMSLGQGVNKQSGNPFLDRLNSNGTTEVDAETGELADADGKGGVKAVPPSQGRFSQDKDPFSAVRFDLTV